MIKKQKRSIGKHNLFVYGTLMFNEILYKLTKKNFKSTPIIIYGFKRYAVIGKNYAAAIPNRNSLIKGKLLFNVDYKSLKILDAFENIKNKEYKRIKIKIKHKNKEYKALIYLYNSDLNKLEDKWNTSNFHKKLIKNKRDKFNLDEFCV